MRNIKVKFKFSSILPFTVLAFYLLTLASNSIFAQTISDQTCKGYNQTPTDSNDFELVPQEFDNSAPQYDLNGLFLNPQWGWQLKKKDWLTDPDPKPEDYPDSLNSQRCKNPCFRDCTGGVLQTDFDPILFCPMCNLGRRKPNRALGHVNWFPATYTGTICFHNCSYPDMDYTFSFVPDGKAGLTRWNPPNKPCNTPKCENAPKASHIEFDSRETVNKFRSATWSDFRNLAGPCRDWDQSSGSPYRNSCFEKDAQNRISKKRAIVIGLIGLDSEHTIYSEIHPVYAIAIEMNDDVDDNTWIVFARNFGNEGNCSSNPHPFLKGSSATQRIDNLKMLLPPPDSVTVPATGDPLVSIIRTEFYRYQATPIPATCPAIPETCPVISKICPLIPGFYDDGQKPINEQKPHNNKGVLLNFVFDPSCDRPDDPTCDQWLEGEIHLKWGGQTKLVTMARDEACITISRNSADAKEEENQYPRPSFTQTAKLLALLEDERNKGLRQITSCPPMINIPLSRIATTQPPSVFSVQDRGLFDRAMQNGRGKSVCEGYRQLSLILFPDFTKECK